MANEKFETLLEFYAQERSSWDVKLAPLYKKIKGNAAALIELQTEFLKLKQEILEDITISLTVLAECNIKLKKLSAERMLHWAHGSGLKYTAKEYITLIEGDLHDQLAEKDLLESHIEFLRECKANCDQIGYAIKARVELLNYARD